MDKDVSKEAQKLLESQGLEFNLSTKVLSTEIDLRKKKVNLTFEKDGKTQSEYFDKVLVLCRA